MQAVAVYAVSQYIRGASPLAIKQGFALRADAAHRLAQSFRDSRFSEHALRQIRLVGYRSPATDARLQRRG
jgi:hypothetical protein